MRDPAPIIGGYGAAGNGAAAVRRRSGVDTPADVDDWPMPLLKVDYFVFDVPAGRSLEQVS
jgi:hypothetical protein